MGEYHEVFCVTCGRLLKRSEQLACWNAGHTIRRETSEEYIARWRKHAVALAMKMGEKEFMRLMHDCLKD